MKDLKTNNLIGRILAEDNCRKARTSSETTLFTKKNQGTKKSKFHKSITCYSCNKKEHLASKCHGSKKKNTSINDNKSKAHYTLDNEDTYKFNVIDEQIFVTHPDLWLADSATQSHIV